MKLRIEIFDQRNGKYFRDGAFRMKLCLYIYSRYNKYNIYHTVKGGGGGREGF